jgi:hypothetical protein
MANHRFDRSHLLGDSPHGCAHIHQCSGSSRGKSVGGLVIGNHPVSSVDQRLDKAGHLG